LDFEVRLFSDLLWRMSLIHRPKNDKTQNFSSRNDLSTNFIKNNASLQVELPHYLNYSQS